MAGKKKEDGRAAGSPGDAGSRGTPGGPNTPSSPGNAASAAPDSPGKTKKQKQENGLLVLLSFAGGRKTLTYVGLALSAIAQLLSFGPYVCVWFVARDLIAVAPNWQQATNIATYGWWAVGFAVASILVYFVALMCTHLAAFRCATNIRKQATEHLMHLPLGYFDSHATGELRRTIDGCAAQTETLLAHILPDTAGSVVMVLGMLVLLFVFDWRLGLACLVSVVVSMVAMASMMSGGGMQIMQQYQDSLTDMNKTGTEYVRGIPVLKVFQQTIYSFRTFHDAIMTYGRVALEYTVKYCRVPQVTNLTAINGLVVFLLPVVLLLAPGVSDMTAFAANFAFYAIFSAIVPTAMAKVMFMGEAAQLSASSVQRIQGVMNAAELPVANEPQHPQDNSVRFDNVSFTYEGSDEPALSGVSFEVPAGTVLALVGPSGGGKSTAASLIPRFWDADSGSVLVGGVDVRNLLPHELMDQVSFVFQTNQLFGQSLADNVRAARPEATDEQVLAALSAAQCGDIVAKLPQGIHTQLGTGGAYLSGGEVQRVALARAILKDAPIVVLDEATAFADPENEALIQAAFTRLAQGRTVIMIAHRLSTVVGADKIVVLNHGRVSEQGMHADLIAAGGLYARMWADYQQAVSWKITAGGGPATTGVSVSAPATVAASGASAAVTGASAAAKAEALKTSPVFAAKGGEA